MLRLARFCGFKSVCLPLIGNGVNGNCNCNVKFEISGLENPKIPDLVEIGQYSQKDAILNPPTRYFEFSKIDVKFEISDVENPPYQIWLRSDNIHKWTPF